MLDVSENAKSDQIRNQFLKLAQYYHPDKMGSDTSQLDKF